MLRRAAIVFVIAAVAGCVRSSATRCGDVMCPVGRACSHGVCVDESVVMACARLAEGDSCNLPEIGTGTCQAKACIVGTCGDGAINAIEACDGANLGNKTCMDFGSSYPEGLKCAADCSFDKSACNGYCGDGTKQSTEQCDGKQFGGKTCITEGFYTGKLVCTDSCMINTGSCSGRCGDNVRNSFTEQCDGTDFGSTDSTCAMRGYLGAVTPLTCTSECGLDPVSCSCGGELGELCAKNTQQCVLRNGIYGCEAYP